MKKRSISRTSEFGDGLGALKDDMLGEFTRDDKADRFFGILKL